MEVVAERLEKIAIEERDENHEDSFGRSAFNRYYYASYLITRDMLRKLNPLWTRTGHSKIPSLLRDTIIKKIDVELRRQQKLGGLGLTNSKSTLNQARKAAEELSNLLKDAYEVRCVADYEPEQKIFRDGAVLKLGEQTIGTARNWPHRASIHTKTLIKIWRGLGLS